jgi:DNA sulfur modification protein DndB
MSSILNGLAAGDELKSIYQQRSKSVDERSITAGSADALKLKLQAEEQDGWKVQKYNKTSIRLYKPKPADRQLEDDVWCLLYRMGFKELNANRQFAIQAGSGTEPRQLDVFAKDDETVFIVECTHAQEPGPKSIKSLIDKIGAIREDVIKGVHGHFGKEPRLKIKFAIATRNIQLSSADRARADAARVPIITEEDLAYFEKLTGLLKTAARYQFLGRYFSGEKVEGLRTRLPATRGRSGNRTFYNFLISPYDLLRISYINHRSKGTNDDLDTYQRMVKPARLKSIGKYIDEGGKFPTNIIINFKSDDKLQFDQKENFGDTATGTLQLPAQYGSAWVIDGQHRLYGYAHADAFANDKSVVTVLAYENLPIREEIDLFIKINTEQVKVSRNLVNEILSTLDIDHPEPRKRLDAMYARIAMRLDSYPTSPIRNRVLTVSQEKTHERCITLTSLTDGMEANNLIGTIHRIPKTKESVVLPGYLTHVSGETKQTVEKAAVTLALYLALFSSKLESHWQLGDAKGGYLCTNLGIRALIQLFRRVLAFVVQKESLTPQVMDPEDIVEKVAPYVAPVIEFFAHSDSGDIESYRKRGSSLQGVDQNCFQMMALISEQIPSFSTPELQTYLSTRDVEGTKQAKEYIDEINRIIFEDVIETLQKHYGPVGDGWWINGVPKGIRNDCDRLYNEHNGEHARWQYLFLINYIDIMMHGSNWDLFKDYYNFYGKGKKASLVRWIVRVNKARTVTHHAEKGPLSTKDVEYVRLVHQLVKTHIEGRVKVTPGKQYIFDDAEATSDVSG